MPLAATRGDALRIKLSGVEVKHHAAVGTIPGVAVLAVSGRNGPGTAQIRSQGDGMDLQWRAPGSPTFGASQRCNADGDYLLEDGFDRDKWARVRVRTAFLSGGLVLGDVLIGNVFGNAIGHDDVTSAEASAGAVETYTCTLSNDSAVALLDIRIWIDAEFLAGTEIGLDGAAWFAPDEEFDADTLTIANLAAGATTTLHIRRTTTAGAVSDTDVMRMIQFSWDGA